MKNQRLRARLIASTGVAGALVASTVSFAHADPAAGVELAAPHLLTFSGEAGGALGSVSKTSCDVNGDGLDDAIVGDPNWNRAGFEEVGAGYVLLGSIEASSGNVADATSGVIRIDGPPVETTTANPWVGASVTCLGDVNKDGVDDFALGSNGRGFQNVAVLFGDPQLQSIDLGEIGTQGFWISDPGAIVNKDNFGYTIAGVGDVNGDGFDDIAIGDNLADYAGTSSGRVWIVGGSDSVVNVDVQTDTSRVLLKVDGLASSQISSVALVGDVNGDQVNDIALSSYLAKPWNNTTTANGAGFVVYGSTQVGRAVSLGALGTDGFAIYGPARGGDRLGDTISDAGDLNGDGFGDVLVGADSQTTKAVDSYGGVAVVYGAATSGTVITDPTGGDATVYTCADTTVVSGCTGSTKVSRGYWIKGDVDKRGAGWTAANLGDVNGDGVPDQVIGSYLGTRVWVTYGRPAGTTLVDLGTLTPETGFVVADGHGRSVGSAGDHDGNGVNDVIMSKGNAVSIALLGPLATTLTLSGDTAVTAESDASITATVQASVPSARQGLEGTLTVSEGGTAVAGCDAVAVTGTESSITCSLPAPSTGSHAYSASFVPASTPAYAAASGTHALTVAAKPSTPGTPGAPAKPANLAHAPKASVKKVRAGKRQVAVVRLGRLSNGQWPTGTVRLRFNGKLTKVKVTAADRGVIRVVLAKKARYTAKARVLKVRYVGNATTAPSKVVTVKVKVTRR